jgi:hypothetical protein
MQEDDMAALDVNRRFLWAGATMFGVGALLCAAGATLGTAAVIGATRRWVGQLEEPPGQVARRRWAQARAATSAGIGAWREDAASAKPDQNTGHRTVSVSG